MLLMALAYIYAGYPLLVILWSRFRPRPVRRAPFAGCVDVVLTTHNDAHFLPRKIKSLLEGGNARYVSSIWIGSDGSEDDPRQRLEEVCGPLEERSSLEKVHEPHRLFVGQAGSTTVRLALFARRRGKVSVLNDLVPLVESEVVVLTDARQPLDERALDRLLRPFGDGGVGVVSGELVFRTFGVSGGGGGVADGLGAYWSYEKKIREAEGRIGSVPGATGALYAMRRNLFRPAPAETLLDDVVFPMVAVNLGGRCIFEPGAMVYDEVLRSAAEESIRKRRTLAGNAQLLKLHPEWLLPWRNRAWFVFLSHKLSRLTSPLLLIGLFLSCLWPPWDAWGLAGILGFGFLILLAILGAATNRRGGILRPASLAYIFLYLNLVTLVALADAVVGRHGALWSRARRSA